MGYIRDASLITNYDYGRPDPGDPVARANLQAEYAKLAQAAVLTSPSYVPPIGQSRFIPPGRGTVWNAPHDPVVGWTAQHSPNAPVFMPYTPTGKTPDWTSDVNPVGAGPYDANAVVNMGTTDPLNQAPIGGDVFDGYSNALKNPNFFPEDQGGLIWDDLDY